NESHLQVADWMYEFVNLSIPMQNVCGEDAEGKSLCNEEVIKKLEQMESNVNKEVNPLWKELEKLKGFDKSEEKEN
ncbi:YceD family protein, partial [Acinetobacter baumannii]